MESKNIIELPVAGAVPNQLGHYIRLIANSYIRLVCEPLKKINIEYFQYVKRLPDLSYIFLTNSPDWLAYYFTRHYYMTSEFENPAKIYETGRYLWSQNSEMHLAMKEKFAIRNGVTFIQVYADSCCEFFHFGTQSDNSVMHEMFTNHSEIFKKFILYFKDQTWETIDALKQYKLIIPTRKGQESNNLNLLIQQFNQLNLLTNIKRYYASTLSPEVYLTKREMECLKWSLSGKTAEEVGYILNISKRTVESYINNVKVKTNCFKKLVMFNSMGVAQLYDHY